MKQIVSKKLTHSLVLVTLSVAVFSPVVTVSANQKPSAQVHVSKKEMSLEEAKKLALQGTKGGKVIEMYLDEDDFSLMYELTVVDGTQKKEIDIDAFSGKIVKSKVKDVSTSKKYQLLAKTGYKVTVDEIEKIVFKRYPKGLLKEISLESEMGKVLYEVTVYEGFEEIQLMIDAKTGQVLSEVREMDED